MDDANLAFSGAIHHYSEIGKLVRTVKVTPDVKRRLHWHFRGFFWELFAARDCLLKARGVVHEPYVRHAEGLEGIPWFEQVRRYRNHLHQSTYVLTAIIKDGVIESLELQQLDPADQSGQPEPAGEALGVLHSYLSDMGKFLKDAPTKQRTSPGTP